MAAPTSDVPRVLALLKQSLQRLQSFGPLEALPAALTFDENPDRWLTKYMLVSKVRDYGQRVDLAVGRVVSDSQMPLVDLPPGLASFYFKVWNPNRQFIEQAYERFWGAVDEGEDRPRRLSKHLDNVLYFAKWKLEDGADFGVEAQDLERLEGFLQSPFVDLDAWYSNLRELRPIISRHPASRFPAQMRRRLVEMHYSYVCGNWLSVAALSRATLEYVLVDRAKSLNVEAFDQASQRVHNLSTLIEMAARARPDLEPRMEVVRQVGNWSLHPRPVKNVEALMARMKDDAFRALSAIVDLVEMLYPPPKTASA